MNYIVYLHRERGTNRIFYVGIGSTRGRAYDEHSRSKEWKEYVQENYFNVEIVAKNLSKKLAEKIESSIIDSIGIENLLNKTLGGSGTRGILHSKEVRERISKKMTGISKPIEQVEKELKTRRENICKDFQHRDTGEIIRGLKWACEKYNIDYKAEHQRIKRNSYNRNFNIL